VGDDHVASRFRTGHQPAVGRAGKLFLDGWGELPLGVDPSHDVPERDEHGVGVGGDEPLGEVSCGPLGERVTTSLELALTRSMLRIRPLRARSTRLIQKRGTRSKA
jgi:hypothetical protein